MKRILTFLFLFSSLFASSQTQFLGAPNTTIVVKGNMKVDSILYLPKRSKTPTDTGALRYQISDSSLYVWTGSAWRKAKNDGTVTSVGLTMPSAFAVANSPVTSSGTLAVTATGTVAEYIRGDGTLGTLPSSGGGGGSGVNYYLNGSVSQGTIGGSTYYEMNKTPVIGAGTDFSRGTDGIVAQFITDSLDPNRLLIPAGAWNFELYFSASSAGGTPSFYVELFEYDGTNFTSIASSVSNPISITNGTAVSLYLASLSVPETVLTATDRLAVRVSVNVSGRTITLHTEDNNLAQVITTFSGGLVSLNGLTANDQFFTTGTSGSDFNISSTSATHTFNLPTASSTVRGALSSSDWTTFNNKVNISDTASMLTNYTRGSGTANYIPKWQGTRAFVNSSIQDNGSAIGVGITPKTWGTVMGVQLGTGGSFTSHRFSSGNNQTFMMNNLYFDNAGFKAINTDVVTMFRSVNDEFRWEIGGNTTADAVASLTQAMTLTNAGNLAIGNTSPSYKLDVSGTLRNTTGAAFATSSGNVLVGTTTDGGSYKLDVQGALRNTTGANFATSSGIVLIGSSASSKIEITPGASSNIEMYGGSGSNSAGGSSYLRARDVTNARSWLAQIDANGDFDWWFNYGGSFFQRQTFTKEGGATIPADTYLASVSGNVGIGNISASEKLHVTGRIRATTIDSTATGMNMLYADATGVIKKAAIPSGGSGTVTSVATGFGLSGGTITTTGTLIVDSAAVATRARVQKGIDSVATLANTKLSGTGITGYFPKWTGTSTQDTSQLFQLGQNIGIGTASPTYRIHLPDAGNTSNQAMIAGTVLGSDGNGQTIRPSGSVAMALFGQNDIGYLYGAAVSSTGRWGINTRSLNDATFNVDGSVKIVTIDSTSTARNMLYQDANGVIKKSAVPTVNNGVINTSIAVASANYTVTSTDHFVYLGDLSSAGRNIVLPNDAVAGRQLIFFNTSNDATYKWTFTNEDVQDITGAAVTTLTNRKTYMLVFYEGVFHIISEN